MQSLPANIFIKMMLLIVMNILEGFRVGVRVRLPSFVNGHILDARLLNVHCI